MKFTILFLAALTCVWAACDKDNFQTKPTVKIESLSADYIPLNGTLKMKLTCTDKEGDVQDSVIIIKRRLNKRVVTTLRDTLRFQFPEFPTNTRTEVDVTLDYQNLLSALNPPTIPGSNPPQREPDTLVLRVAVRDRAGHTSDTVESRQIIVFRQ